MSDTAMQNRNILLTGATGGLGSAIGRALAQAGAALVLSDREGTPLKAHVEELRSLGARVECVTADLTDRAAIPDLAKRAEEVLGPIDVLINNAGVEFAGTWVTRTVDNIGIEADLNLVAPMILTRAVLPGMVERGRGHVVGISSIGGLMDIPLLAGYAGTKKGLAAYMRAMAAEMAGTGVRFSTVYPGLIRDQGMGAKYTQTFPPLAARLLTKQPEAVGLAVVKILGNGRQEIVVSATPARPFSFLAVVAPRLSVRTLQPLRGAIAKVLS